MSGQPAPVPGPAEQPPVDGRPAGPAVVVVVRVGAGRYALPLPAVTEVGRSPQLTRVPGAPGWLSGLANWRGRLLPVVDLARLLAEPPRAGAGGRVVLVAQDRMSLGLTVDAVESVDQRRGGGPVAPPPATIDPAARRLVAAQWCDQHGPLGLLDVPALFRLREALAG